MAKAQRILCEFCPNGRIDIGSAFCTECGSPTVWASHDDRVQWEVGQWRRTRTTQREGERHISSVATIARPERAPAAEPEVARKTAAMSSAPLEVVEPSAEKSWSFLAWFKEIWRRFRDKLDNPMNVPDDVAVKPVEEPKIEEPKIEEAVFAEPIPLFDPEPVVVAEPEPVVVAPLAVVEPVTAVVEAPARVVEPVAPAPIVAKAPKPRKPRKPVQRPTNKDMLKSALDVLKKVDERLDHVEKELAEIDGAVRAKRARKKAREDRTSDDGTVDIEQLPL